MSAITFPNSPSAGEQHTINGITYTFTDGTWVAVGQSNLYTLPIATPTVLGGVKSGGTGITIANDGVISIATGSTFDTNDVDSHLNQSNPTADYVLSWSGTDYAWVEQSGSSTTINNNAADRVILGSATADTLNADGSLTYTKQGSNTYGKPLLTIGDGNDGDCYLDIIGGSSPNGSDKKIQLRSTDTYAYLYASCDGDFHIEHNRAHQDRTPGAAIKIGAVGDHNAIFVLDGESILNHADNEKIRTTTDGVKITGGIQDKDSQLGTNGQVLTSTGTQLDWVDASTLSISSPIPAFQSNWRIPL